MSPAGPVQVYQAACVVTLSEQGSIVNGAVAVQGEDIIAVGPTQAVLPAYPDALISDLGGRWLMPGLRNGHGHFGEWPADKPLELFLVGRYAMASSPESVRALARRTAASLLCSGVTWTHHLHYGPHADSAIAGYLDVGLRLQFCLGALDRYSVLPYDEGDAELLGMLNDWQRRSLRGRSLGKTPLDWDSWLASFSALQDQFRDHPRVEIIAGPDNPQWCSDSLLRRLRALNVPLHLHVQETAAQRHRAVAVDGRSPVSRLAELGILGDDVTLAHVTHADDADLNLIATSGATVVVNASSNLRLGSGIPTVSRLLAHGIGISIGLDGGGFADDLDMLTEIRLNALLSRAGSTSWAVGPSAPLRSSAGQLRPGLPADLVALRMPPGGEQDPERAIVARASRHHVTDVWVAGRSVLAGGVPIRVAAADLERPASQQQDSGTEEVLRPYVNAALQTGH